MVSLTIPQLEKEQERLTQSQTGVEQVSSKSSAMVHTLGEDRYLIKEVVCQKRLLYVIRNRELMLQKEY